MTPPPLPPPPRTLPSETPYAVVLTGMEWCYVLAVLQSMVEELTLPGFPDFSNGTATKIVRLHDKVVGQINAQAEAPNYRLLAPVGPPDQPPEDPPV